MRKWLVLLAPLAIIAIALWLAAEPESERIEPLGVRSMRRVEAAPSLGLHDGGVDEPRTDAPIARGATAPLDAGKSSEATSEAPLAQQTPAPTASSDAPNRRKARADELLRAAARVTAPGLCESERKARDALLAEFRRVDFAEGTLLIDPVLPETIIERVLNALRIARRNSSELGVAPQQPLTVVYRSLDQMRSVSCVNTSAYGYYDGAIHLSGNPNGGLVQLEETLVHEYVHHLLLQQNVRLPMWLSEGTAMLIANETWWQHRELGLLPWARSTHLPFEMLVPAFAHATDEQTATHLYFQSFLMVELIRGRGGMPALATLISRLGKGLVSPDDAFGEAVGVEPGALDRTFHEWVQTVSLRSAHSSSLQ